MHVREQTLHVGCVHLRTSLEHSSRDDHLTRTLSTKGERLDPGWLDGTSRIRCGCLWKFGRWGKRLFAAWRMLHRMRRCRVFASSVEGWPDFATWEVKMRLIDFACASANPSTASTSSWIRRPPSRQTRRCSAARASARRQAPHASSSTAVLALPTSTCADVDALHHRHPHLPPRMLMALLPMTSRAWPREPRLPTLAIASQTDDAQFQ